jgi:hypothetical protein
VLTAPVQPGQVRPVALKKNFLRPSLMGPRGRCRYSLNARPMARRALRFLLDALHDIVPPELGHLLDAPAGGGPPGIVLGPFAGGVVVAVQGPEQVAPLFAASQTARLEISTGLRLMLMDQAGAGRDIVEVAWDGRFDASRVIPRVPVHDLLNLDRKAIQFILPERRDADECAASPAALALPCRLTLSHRLAQVFLPSCTHKHDIGQARGANQQNLMLFVRLTVSLHIHTADPRYEAGHNMATADAMAAGLPVLSSAHPTSPIRHGVSGFISDNPATLRRCAQILLEDRDLAEMMGRQARKTVIKQFSLTRFRDCFLRSIETARRKWHTRKIDPSVPALQPHVNAAP